MCTPRSRKDDANIDKIDAKFKWFLVLANMVYTSEDVDTVRSSVSLPITGKKAESQCLIL